MDEKLRERLKEALKEGTLYGFVANNGYAMDKEELITLVKELDYLIFKTFGEEKCIELENQLLTQLEEDTSIFDEE